MSTPTIDYDSLAQAAGGVASPAASPAPANASAKSNAVDYDALAQAAGGTAQAPPSAQTGQETNDVGNTVIVPKDGESFADTMKRAAAAGGNVTQSDIDKEMATAPKKVAETLVAAPAIGAVGAGLLAAPGELYGLASQLPQLGSQTINAAKALAQAHPEAAKTIGKMLLTGALGGDLGHSAKTALLGALLGSLIK